MEAVVTILSTRASRKLEFSIIDGITTRCLTVTQRSMHNIELDLSSQNIWIKYALANKVLGNCLRDVWTRKASRLRPLSELPNSRTFLAQYPPIKRLIAH